MSDIAKTCIVCPAGCLLTIRQENGEWIVSGNRCPRGKQYAIQEVTDPRRTVTATAATDSEAYPRLPLKSAEPVPPTSDATVYSSISSPSVQESTTL